MVTAELTSHEQTAGIETSLPDRSGRRGRWQIPAFVLGLLMLLASFMRPLGIVGDTGSLVENQARKKLDQSLAALESGRHAKARALAEEMLADEQEVSSFPGGAAYVLGMAAYRDAEEKHGSRARDLFTQAAALLEEAHDRGVPDEYQAILTFRLGKSLLLSGHVERSRSWLEQAADAVSGDQIEATELLVESVTLGSERDFEKGLRANDHLLRLDLSTAQRDRALLQRGKILFALERHAEAAEVLEKLTPGKEQAKVGVLLRVRALIAHENYAPALEVLGAMTSDKSLRGTPLLQAIYLTGVARHQLGQDEEALIQFDRVQQVDPHVDEAVAAALDTADILLSQGRPKEALASYSAALEQVDSLETFQNAWVELGAFQRRVQKAWDVFYEAEDYASAAELARASVPILGETTSTLLRARTLEQWGHWLRTRADESRYSKAQPLRDQAHTHLRDAGRAYRHLAELRRPTAHYQDDLWQSAENLLAGHDYEAAVAALELFLSTNPQTRRAQALVSLGRARMALEQFEKAVARFDECRETAPKDPATFEANYLRGVCYVEMGTTDLAEQVFRENLEGEFLNPSAVEWRLSLFALGKLLYQTGQYDAAIEKLFDATDRYKTHEKADEARYLIAEAYRKSATMPKENFEGSVNDAVRDHYREELQERLNHALDVYRSLQADLLARQREGIELSAQEERLLRNCYFATGRCWYEMGNYQEAKDAYSTAANRYQQQPDSLEAYVQIANCYRRLKQPKSARSTLETARIVLKQIPDESFPSQATSLTRQEWDDWLDWAVQQLELRRQ